MTSSVPLSLQTTLVFIDSAVDDYQHLVGGIVNGAEAIALDAHRDGVDQITHVLASRRNVEQIHIISHGAPGRVYVGASCLSDDTLGHYRTALKQWAQSLSSHAEILLYGCEVAAGDRGQSFIHRLSQLFQASVAASTTRIGNAALGGNWDLDAIVGRIQSPLAVQAHVQQTYPAVLAPIGPNLLYGVNNTPATPGVETEIVTIDTTTGATTIVGTLLFDSFAIARDVNSGDVFYIQNVAGNPQVALWNPTTGENTLIGSTGTAGVVFLKLAQAQNGTLFGFGSGQQLYTIDPDTGVATLRDTFALNTGSGDAAFDPDNPNRLIISVTDAGLYDLFAVDVSNPDALGTPEFLGSLSDISGNTGAGSLAFAQDGRLYASSGTDLYVVNFTPAGLVDATNPTDLVGPMSTNISDFGTLPNNPAEIDIAITKTDNRTTIGAGQTITYTVTVTNPSAIDAPSLQVLDQVPATITNVNWSAVITGGGGFINASQGTGNAIDSQLNLSAGASVTYTITGTIPLATPDSTLLENTVTVQQIPGTPADQVFIDANLANNTATDTTTVVDASQNQPPVATNDTVQTDDGTAVSIPVLANDSDPDGDPLEILNNFTQPANGTVVLNNNGTPANPADDFFVYTPNAGFEGTDTFIYTITDGRGGEDSATVSVEVEGGGGVGGNIDAVNDRVRTSPQPVNIFVLRNDTSSSEPVRLVGIGQQASNGTVSINNNGTPNNLTDDFVVYTPNAGFLGIDTFTYIIEGGLDPNGNPLRDTATVTIEVAGTPGCLPGDPIIGGAGRDVLVGTINSDPMFGRGGNDVLRGLECDDVLRGGRGNDVLKGGADQDTLYGNQGNDFLQGGSGDDVLSGGLGRDTLVGGAGSDRLRGGRGNDLLEGRRGNDILAGNLGDDILFGGGGRDRLDGGAGNDILDGGANADVIQGGPGDDRARGGSGDDVINGGLGNDFLQGNKGSDRLFGRKGDDTLQGGSGDDVLDGGLGNDRIRGGAGDDIIRGGNGDDIIEGGLGNDAINAGLGNDNVSGGRGNDRIRGGRGDDIIRGNAGRDVLDGGLGNDIIRGGANNDIIYGRGGDDVLRGGGGDDLIIGGLGDDYIGGGNGNDILFGGRGNDRINGGAGDDIIIGSLGRDRLTGGSGRDRFVYQSARDGRDIITDFEVGLDLIDLSQIFDDPRYTARNPFRRFVDIAQVGVSTVVRIDPNGNDPEASFVTIATLQNVVASSVRAQSFLL